MSTRVVGLFDRPADAHALLRELHQAGVSEESISFIGSNARGEHGEVERERQAGGMFDKEGDGLDTQEGAAFGATSGALVGGTAGLLAGLGALAIPGIGPIVAGGAIASALTGTAAGAGAGAVGGGVIGALVGAGIPEEEAHVYAESLRRGGSMVMVEAESDAEATRATDLMSRHNVVDIDKRGEEYRESGWTRFDQEAAPYAGVSSTGYAAPEITGYAPDRSLSSGAPATEPEGDADTVYEEEAEYRHESTASDHLDRDIETQPQGDPDSPSRPTMTGTSGSAGGEGTAGTAGAVRITPDDEDSDLDRSDVEEQKR